MDKIIVKGLRIFAYHGVNPEETENGQYFVLDITLHLPLDIPCRSDRLEDTVNYSRVCKTATRAMNEGPYQLIERAAGAVAERLLADFPTIERVDVCLKKPQAPVKADFAYMAVEITRKRGEWR